MIPPSKRSNNIPSFVLLKYTVSQLHIVDVATLRSHEVHDTLIDTASSNSMQFMTQILMCHESNEPSLNCRFKPAHHMSGVARFTVTMTTTVTGTAHRS